MRIEILPDSFPSSQYNNIAFHPLQLWEWGNARKKMGLTVIRFGEYSKDNLFNTYQMTIHTIPHTPFSIGYIPRSHYPSPEFIKYIQEFGRTHKLIFIKFEPYTLKSEIPTINNQQLTSIKISSHPLFPSWTQILNISNTEENLMKKMKSKTRYNIKLAQKKGVVVKEMSSDKGFEIFSTLYFDTCKRQKYYGHNKEYHNIVWNTLKEKIAHILIAFYKDIPLAAYELFFYKKRLYYIYGGTSIEHRNLMAANLLMWEAILLGKKLNADILDMWGSLPPNYNQNHDWAGFTRFKEGYGTDFVELCDSFDLICNPLLYKSYNIVYTIRQLALRYR